MTHDNKRVQIIISTDDIRNLDLIASYLHQIDQYKSMETIISLDVCAATTGLFKMFFVILDWGNHPSFGMTLTIFVICICNLQHSQIYHIV